MPRPRRATSATIARAAPFALNALDLLGARPAARRASGSGLTLRRFLPGLTGRRSSSSSRRAGSSSSASRTSRPACRSLLDRKALRDARPGDLVVVRTGRGRAKVERVLGPAEPDRDRARGRCSSSRARARRFEPYDAAGAEPRGPRRPARPADVHDRPRHGEGLRRRDLDRPRGRRRPRLRAHRRRLATSSRPARRSTAAPPSARSPSTCPGCVAPMLPPELSDELCSLRPNDDRLCVTVEIPLARTGEPQLLPLGDPQRRAADVRPGRGDPGRPRASSTASSTRRCGSPSSSRRAPRAAASPAARCGSRAAEVAFAFDGEGGVARAWLEGEPHAHMLVEELMILANEAVAELLAGRRREALYRVHERPEPQSIALLLAKLADLGVPTPPAPDRRSRPPTPRGSPREIERARDRVRRAVRPRPRGLPGARPPVAEAGALRPAEPRPLGPRQPGVLPLHVADPPLPRPRRATARCCASSAPRTSRCPEDLDELAEHASAREREAAKLEYRADEICLAWLLERRLFERGWEATVRGRDHRR